MTAPLLLRGAYRAVLRLYPAEFQRAVGPAMLCDLREGWTLARRERGVAGAMGFALRQLLDLIGNLGGEWRYPSGRRGPDEETGLGSRARSLVHDLLFAARSLRRDPGFSAVVLFVVGLGFAAVVTVYGMVDAILLEPMPYPAADRLVSMSESYRVTETKSVAYHNYLDWKARNRVFEDVGARTWSSFNLTGDGTARSVRGIGLTPGALAMFGVEPIRGRTFDEAESNDRERVIVVREGFWRDTLGADPQVPGRELRLDGETYTVIGVIPDPTEFPLAGVDLWLPLPTTLSEEDLGNRGNHPGIEAYGRLRDGVTLEQARADLGRVAAELAAEYPDTNTEAGVVMTPLRDRVVGDGKVTVWILFAAVGLVLLGICTNVASLMLARATRRGGEIAVRAALGAGRGRIVRQLLAEGALLLGLAGVLGLGVATFLIRLVRGSQGLRLPRLSSLEVDVSVALFALGAAVACGMLFALVPALRLARTDAAAALRGAAGDRGVTRDARRGRSALVVVQVALAVVLLAGAGLMLRSLDNLTRAKLGVSPGHVVTGYVGPPQSIYPDNEDRVALYRAFAARVASLPGVTAVSSGDPLPLSGRSNQWTISHEGFPQIDEQGLRVDIARVMPDYFDVMGIGMLAGRDFRHDDAPEEPVVIVDETLASFLWPDGDALGNRLRFRGEDPNRAWFTVVGVVEHVKNYGARAESRHELYFPYTLFAWGTNFVVEVEREVATEAVLDGMRRELAAIDPELPITRVGTIGYLIDDSVAAESLLTRTLVGFAGAALAVAVIGLYGLIAYSVVLRRRELGIRMALGADRRTVLGGVLAEGAALAGIGVALGIGGALVSGRLLTSLLYGVEPADPVTLGGVAAIMTVVALLAAALPARQAVRVDPTVALRD